MSKFEFIVTIVSIVIAFAMSEVMAGWGRLLRRRSQVDFYWAYSGWSAGLLFFMVIHWAGLWVYESSNLDSIAALFVLLASPLVLVFTAFLLTPEILPGKDLDLRAHYFAVARPALLSLAGFGVLSVVADAVVLESASLLEAGVAMSSYAGLLCWAAFSGRELVHAAVLAIHWAFCLSFLFGLAPTPGW